MAFSLRLVWIGWTALLLAPARLAAVPAEVMTLVGAAVVGQKSVLDEEEEEPLAKTPSNTTSSKKATKLPKTPAPQKPLPQAPVDGTSDAGKPEKPAVPSQEGLEEEAADRPEDSQKDQDDEADFYDIIYRRRSVNEPPYPLRITPLTEYLGSRLSRQRSDEDLEFSYYSPGGTIPLKLPGRQIDRIYYYEQRIGDLAAKQVKLSSLEQLAAPGRMIDLSDEVLAEGARRAETMLDRALAEHDSAVQRRLRLGAAWNKALREPLVLARINLRLSAVDGLIRQEKFRQAETECERLAGEIDRESSVMDQVRARLEEILELRARELLNRQDFAAVREMLDQFTNRYPGSPGPRVVGLQKTLADKAGALVRQARQAEQSSPQKAVALYERAAEICPALPGLGEKRRRLVASYPVLHCAYRELPRSLCPLTARTPVERHAVSLIYESLVRGIDDPRTGAHYECQLAEGRPTPLARGRSFRLPPCQWSDSRGEELHYCTVEDVRWTVKALRNRRCPGYSPVRSSLLKEVSNAEDGDPRRALMYLERDYWQPLSLMNFKILPMHVLLKGGASDKLPERLKELALHPVGTGPYRLAGDAADMPETLRFVANPRYRYAGLPHIREIVFYRMEPTAAVEAFQRGKMDLIYGLLLEHVNQLRQHRAKIETLSVPAVWFLAPNYRRPNLRDENLRLAIAHAIDREAILKQFFRPGEGGAEQVALSGPYPRDSWAYNPRVEDFSPAKAAVFAEAAKKKLHLREVELQLLYPAGDPAVESACKQIQLQVRPLGIELTLSAAEPARFYEQVTQDQDFDLAYWSHEFENSAFWLEPLLDAHPLAQAPGGPNFMGSTPDADLARLFRDLNVHKCFREIQTTTWGIHEHVARTAVVIPLWQLRTYVAVSQRLRDAVLDPLILFGNVERWKVDPSAR
ncbi:MAG: hypothetical protein JXB10_04145 [Pirellulales bacterium]|nr:hypothetical protein [Pirellulales bacterium]